jgi:hypothetical protein
MDQLRVAYKFVREYWYWISCGVIFVLGLAIWFLVTNSLAWDAATFRQQRNDSFSIAQQVSDTGEEIPGRLGKFHPNQVTEEEMNAQISILKESVLKAWAEQHKSQGERVFEWPPELPEAFRNEVLKIITRELASGVRERMPIEMAIKDPNGPELLNINYRSTYGSYIKRELPKLAEQISAVWQGTSDEAARVGARSPMSTAEGPRPIVNWSVENQNELSARFNWAKQDRGAPTTLQVLYSQEDLRVLESIMDVIKATNKYATADFNAAIKRIDYIKIGRSAASERGGSVMRLGSSGASQAPSAGGGGFSSDDGFSADGISSDDSGLDDSALEDSSSDDSSVSEPPIDAVDGGGGVAGQTTPQPSAAESNDPAHMRYVDLNYKPLAAETLRKSFNRQGDVTVMDPGVAKLAVAKRLPVRIKLGIDQRKLHELLVQCGNSPLTIEVRQVRVNPTAGAATQRPGFNSGGSADDPWSQFGGGSDPFSSDPFSSDPFSSDPFSSDDSGGSFNGGGFNGGGFARRQTNAESKDKNTQYDVTVELYGIIYIYNPVDESILGPKQEAPPPAGSVPGNVAVNAPR